MSNSKNLLVLGIDEAGYGPNIGPLVIGCSAWIIKEHRTSPSDRRPAAESLLERLSPVFQAKSDKASFTHIPLGDSKALYSSGDSLDSLAIGVRFWMNSLADPIKSFHDFLSAVSPNCIAQLDKIPWYKRQTTSRPSIEFFQELSESISSSLLENANRTCEAQGVQLLGIAATVIDEGRFNRDVEKYGNKASLLSQASLRLAESCLKKYAIPNLSEIGSIHVYCDKHGGRNRYQAFLMDVMPELWFDALSESASRSDYRAEWQDLELNWSFLAKGDRLVASALASMTAKWIREGLMSRLNHFWELHLPGLKSTAGYPVDAKRFRLAIEPIADRLGFRLEDWWRAR